MFLCVTDQMRTTPAAASTRDQRMTVCRTRNVLQGMETYTQSKFIARSSMTSYFGLRTSISLVSVLQILKPIVTLIRVTKRFSKKTESFCNLKTNLFFLNVISKANQFPYRVEHSSRIYIIYDTYISTCAAALMYSQILRYTVLQSTENEPYQVSCCYSLASIISI